MIALHEKGLHKYDSRLISFAAGEHKSPEILALNPRGQVPTMKDGELVLSESMAACHYLANTYNAQGNPLFPTDPEQYAATIQAMYEVGNLQGVYSGLYKFHRTHSEEAVGKDILLWGQEYELKTAIRRELDFWEAKLGSSRLHGGQFIAGPTFSIADIALFPQLAFLVRQGFKFGGLPALGTYYHHMCQRNSVQATWPPHWKDSAPPTQRLNDL